MADDPYGDPYAAPQVALNVPAPTIGNPEAAAQYLEQHRSAFRDRETQRQQVEAKQQLNTDQMTKILDDATAAIRKSREGRTNLPMLAMAAGLMGPGNFGDQVGRGFAMMGPAIAQQRKEDDQAELQTANLSLKGAELRNAPLSEKLAYIKALQMGDLQAIRAIEQAQVRSAAPGQDPAIVKEWRAAQASDPKFKDMTYPQYVEWKQTKQARSPADIQYMDQINKEREAKGLPPIDLIEAGRLKKEAEQKGSATGRTIGESQGTALHALPSAISTAETLDKLIDRVLEHPGFQASVGNIQGLMPNVTQPAVDFNALLKTIAGRQFLAAFETLKGAGAITEIEGTKATEALGNLNPRQSPEQFKQALRDIQNQTRIGIKNARQKAGIDPLRTEVPPSPPGQTGLTPPGGIKEGVQAVHPQTGNSLPDGQTATDKATGKRLVVRGGVWTTPK
jgi:hypothetical protein